MKYGIKEILDQVAKQFDKATGLDKILYGRSDKPLRSASEGDNPPADERTDTPDASE